MPSSRPDHLGALCNIVLKSKPKSVLDVGVGFGRFGLLCREYLDLWGQQNPAACHNPALWKTRVDGIEVFPAYIGPLQEMLYSTIHIGDARTVLPTLGHYGLIHLGDVIEHMPKAEGHAFLKVCRAKAKLVIVVTPVVCRPQGASFGNVHETHHAGWTPQEFKVYPGASATAYGTVLMAVIPGTA
tara:strand:+ start:2966 stop:3520 length:555 start_codon:yes stop_codon:yes gene_type:complete